MAENLTIRSGDVELVYETWGPPDGPLAVLLHGFPDSATTWRHLGPALAEVGFRAVAPWMRGYAPSSASAAGVYQTGALAMDAIASHDQLGGDERAVLVGHDWGAPGAYGASVHAPDRWARVVGMAVPPGPEMATALLVDLDQVRRSWYMFLFQHPLAEAIVGNDDLAFVDMLWSDWSPGYDATDDLADVKSALRDPANLGAAIGYYRCALGTTPPDPSLDDVQRACFAPLVHPARYLHGRDDGCVGADVAERARATAGDDVAVEIVDGAGHFLHLERPDVVNAAIVDFLT